MEAVLVELERLPALRLRRVLAVGGGAALAAATALAVMGWPGHERPCRGAEARLAGIWDDPVRAGLRRAFVATGGRRGGADLVGAVGERAGVERRPGRLGESDGQPARGLERGPSMEGPGPELGDELGPASRAGLVQHLRHVQLDGVLGAVELGGDLLIRQTAQHALEDLGLAGREVERALRLGEPRRLERLLQAAGDRDPSSGSSETYMWLGAAPQLKEWLSDREFTGFRVKGQTVDNKDFAIGLEIKQNEVAPPPPPPRGRPMRRAS